ncbi:hypothetical protein DH2020_017546 [Rehmannia glutinosa]|uniref:Uncharacterized protein n=1 Tax=Rehmannia glutinosa TaxID=99300 RepID=A0ABR0WRT8_REHGL
MASEKKASEGIALLSMYGDEDDEMEDLDEEGDNHHEEDIPPPASDAVIVKDNDALSDYGNENMPPQQEERGLNDNSTPNFNFVQSKKSRMLIVDYGHEEGAMSPEAEEGEILATGRVMYGEQLQTSDGEFREKKSPGIPRLSTPSTQATPPQSLEPIDQFESDAMSYAVNESESGVAEDAVMVSVGEQKAVDPLDKFLPPPPKDKCSEELQSGRNIWDMAELHMACEKIIKFLALKKTTGRSFNSEVRNRKEYRNPDFLLHAVTYQDIDQIGSCFHKDVFDPHGYDKSDFYDEIEWINNQEADTFSAEMSFAEMDTISSVSCILLVRFSPAFRTRGDAHVGLTAVAGGVLNVTPAASDVTARDGRHNKKSKWDKVHSLAHGLQLWNRSLSLKQLPQSLFWFQVDVDQRNSLAPGGQENMSVSAHAALLSAAKAGSGYSAFA